MRSHCSKLSNFICILVLVLVANQSNATITIDEIAGPNQRVKNVDGKTLIASKKKHLAIVYQVDPDTPRLMFRFRITNSGNTPYIFDITDISAQDGGNNLRVMRDFTDGAAARDFRREVLPGEQYSSNFYVLDYPNILDHQPVTMKIRMKVDGETHVFRFRIQHIKDEQYISASTAFGAFVASYSACGQKALIDEILAELLGEGEEGNQMKRLYLLEVEPSFGNLQDLLNMTTEALSSPDSIAETGVDRESLVCIQSYLIEHYEVD